MKIVENSAQRVVITEGRFWWFGYVLALAVGSIFSAIGAYLLFADLANLFAPGWAEVSGLSGVIWRSGDSGDGPPLPRIGSLAVSIVWTSFSLHLLIFATVGLSFSGRRSLDFDFRAGCVTLSVGGLFRLRQHQFPLSDIKAAVIRESDEPNRLSVAATQPLGQPTAEIWSAGLFGSKSISPAQERELEGLFRTLPMLESRTSPPLGAAQPSP